MCQEGVRKVLLGVWKVLLDVKNMLLGVRKVLLVYNVYKIRDLAKGFPKFI